MNRTCCAKYKRPERNTVLWRLPWINCTKTASITEFSSSGTRVNFRCKVHKNCADINWREIDLQELTPQEIEGLKAILRKFAEHCADQADAWCERRNETVHRLAEIERSNK